MLDSILRDLRFAGRMLRKTPGFTVIALVTLAVGIGVNTAVFTVVNGLLLEPLPFPEPDRLATVLTIMRSPRGHRTSDTVRRSHVPGHSRQREDGRYGRARRRGQRIGRQSRHRRSCGKRESGPRERRVPCMGVTPLIGREFNPDEDREGGQPVAMFSYGPMDATVREEPGDRRAGNHAARRAVHGGRRHAGRSRGRHGPISGRRCGRRRGEGGGRNYGCWRASGLASAGPRPTPRSSNSVRHGR